MTPSLHGFLGDQWENLEKLLGNVSGTSHDHRTKWKYLTREPVLNSSTRGGVNIDSACADDSHSGKYPC